MEFLHLSTPKYGGWITYASHLILRDYPNKIVYKVSKKLEKTTRDYGFGVRYQNIPKEALRAIQDPVIISLDSHFYDCVKYLNEPTVIIHDTAEPSKKEAELYQSFKRVLTPRKATSIFLKEEYGIDSEFVGIPFYDYPKGEPCAKTGAISMTRVEWRKNQDIICKANAMLENPIDIWGKRNLIYVFHTLNELGFEKWAKGKKNTGAYDMNWETRQKILNPAKFSVDLAKYVRDGGGTDYCILEAIHHDTALILHRDWVNIEDSIWKEGYNCLAVETPEELANLIKEDPDVTNIVKNSKPILKEAMELKVV